MSKLPPRGSRRAPEAFAEHNHRKYERTVQLTRQAIDKLEKESQTVTLAMVCEATRTLDEQGRGLRPITVLRNPQAAELFRQHSPAYQARQQKAKKLKHKRSLLGSEVGAPYRGLRLADLIQMVEDLKRQMVELHSHQDQLQHERDEAYHLRDEALHQSVQQLAALTQLTYPAQGRSKRDGD